MSRRYSASLYLQIFFIVALIGLLSVFFKFDTVNADDHARRVNLLLRMGELDAQLDQAALQVFTHSLVQYDSLNTFYDALDQVQNDVQNEQLIGFAATTAEIEHSAKKIVGLLYAKKELIERMKTQSALLRNGLLYLPTLAQQLADHPFSYVVSPETLVTNLISFNRLGSSSSQLALLERLSLIDRWLENHPDDELIENFRSHIHFNLNGLNEKQQIQSQYIEIPSKQQLETLRSDYLQFYSGKVEAANNLRTNLLAVCVILMLGIVYILKRLDSLRREAQEASKLLQDAIESLSEGFALYSPTGELQLINSRWLSLYGLSDRAQMPPTLEAFNAPGFGCVLEEETERDEATGLSQIIHKTATGRWLQVSNTRTSSGAQACVRVDITDYKRVEHQLRMLGRAVEQSPTSIVITDVKGVIEYVNPKFEQVTGYSVDEIIGQNPRVLRSGYTSSRDYSDLWESLLAGKEWRGTFFNQRKDGSLYWEAASISPIRDKTGKITNFVAIKEDITRQKLANDELKTAAAVFEATQEGIMTTDANLSITAVNPAFTAITGYTEEEVIGKKPTILSSGQHDKDFYNTMWSQLNSQGRWSSEIWNKRKDGSLYPQWLSVSVIHDDKGEVAQYIAIITDMTERKKHEEQIHRQAYYDALTGLPNRSLLMDRMDHDLKLSSRNELKSSLLFIDLDRFKKVNDTMGHEVGDRLLVEVAKRLQALVRSSDTISRFGGDEFVVLLSNVPDENHASVVADKIVTALKQPFHIDGFELLTGASIGIALSPSDSSDPIELLRLADLAMYKAKESGRNQYHFFAQSMQEKAHRRAYLEQKLHGALEDDALQVFYQPIVHLHSGEIYGVEALARWCDPDEGMIAPDEFIPVAEESGLILALGQRVLEKACKDMQALATAGHWLHLSVNVSSRQYSLGFSVEDVREVCRKTGFSSQALSLELTESILLDDDAEVLNWLAAFKAEGIRLSIDDFGTGYSSLSYLKRFPISTLKIDREFISGLGRKGETSSLVNAIISMAESLGMQVIAEGVETQAQLQVISNLECDLVQGFYFSKPVPLEALTEWLDHYQPKVTEPSWEI